MDSFAKDASKHRADAFQECAARMNIQPAIVEKDFWVCWTLRRSFALADQAPGLIFKGGTSLSKAYGVIRRFSEDIDLSLDRHDLGFTGARDPASDMSNKARKKLLEELDVAAIDAIGGPILEALRTAMSTALGCEAELAVSDDDKQTLLFRYPASLPRSAEVAYVQPVIRLEFGARSDHIPAEQRTVTPYVSETFTDLIADPSTQVKTLAASRTFWEKATILHMLFHSDPEKPLGDRMSRHYYDLSQLARTDVRTQALEDLSLLDAVASHKSIFFRSGSASYETARPPTLRLSPHAALEKALRQDYARMAEMLFDAPESFDDLLEELAALESDINKAR